MKIPVLNYRVGYGINLGLDIAMEDELVTSVKIKRLCCT